MLRKTVAELEPNHLTAEHESAPPSAFSGTILLAEDNAINRVLAVRLLTRRGYQVQTAQDGLEAVELFRRQPVDVILMDIQMPKMDGNKATQTLRKQGYKGPIIALTANALKSERENALKLGFDDYITKPIEKKELYASLKRFDPRTDSDHEDLTLPYPIR